MRKYGKSMFEILSEMNEATFTYDGVNKAKIDTSQTYAVLQLDGSSGGAIEFYDDATRKFEIYGIDAGIEIYDREKVYFLSQNTKQKLL